MKSVLFDSPDAAGGHRAARRFDQRGSRKSVGKADANERQRGAIDCRRFSHKLDP